MYNKTKYILSGSIKRRRLMAALSAVVTGLIVFTAMPAKAAPRSDATGDFLTSFDDPHAGDLDVTSVDARRASQATRSKMPSAPS